jgi:hypothetical protein
MSGYLLVTLVLALTLVIVALAVLERDRPARRPVDHDRPPAAYHAVTEQTVTVEGAASNDPIRPGAAAAADE